MNFTDFRKSTKASANRFLDIFIIFAVCILLYIVAYICDRLFNFSELFTDNSIWYHIVLLFSVVISLSIFLISFYSYSQINNFRMIVAGYTFLTVGLLDALHIFNFPGVIFSITEWENETFLVWMITRFLNVVGFSLVAVVSDQSHGVTKRRYLILLSCIMVSLTYSFVALDHFKLKVFVEDEGLTVLGITILLVVAVMYIFDVYLTISEYKKTGDSLYKTLACTYLLMFFNAFSIINSSHFYDMQNLLSQVYQLVSYAILFNVFFVHGIQRPNVLLIKAKDELNEYLSELDQLVDKRTTQLRCINEKLMADQEIARGMQLSMLPASLPKNDYVAFSSGYVPAENLSGDFYNVIKIDEVRFGICIGDVSGHGISAAMLSIFTFQKIQSLMEEKGGEGMTIPSLVLKHLYDSFNSANFNEDMYIVMLYGVLNIQTGIFSYASGGLNTSPLRIRPDGSIQELDNDGFAICKLGNIFKPKFINRQILLFPGDKLLLYTDGLIDARNKANEEYSLARLKNTILRHYKWGVDHLSEAIIEDVQNYTVDEPDDDITLLVVDILLPF